MRSKQGMNPIIATVLLLMLTMTIGATTFAFIKGIAKSNISSTQEDMTKIECNAKVAFEIVKSEGIEQICKNTTAATPYVKGTLTNSGSRRILGFRFVFLDGNDVGIEQINDTVPVSGYHVLTANVSSSIANPTEIMIEPIIEGVDGDGLTTQVVCSDTKLTKEYALIAEC